MKKSYDPAEQDLPSTKQLVNSTLLAAGVAAALLVTVVLPAEYGIDPTGIGSITGLKKMGEIRVSLEKEAAADRTNSSGASVEAKQDDKNKSAEASKESKIADVNNDKLAAESTSPSTDSSAGTLKHEMQVKLAPDEGAEIKVEMTKGNKVQYTWSTDSGKANFDVHGDSKTLGIDYHKYSKGSSQSEQGSIEAAFDGSHGWFWRNRTSNPIVITLKTEGQYTEINRKK
jgi:hypothetical protein